MRILVVHPGPGFSVHDVYAGWVEALRALDQTVIEFPLGDLLTFYETTHIEVDGEWRKAVPHEHIAQMAMDRLAAALFKTRPHVLLLVSGFFADVALLDMARRQGTCVIALHTESPYEDERQLKLAPHCDLNLLNDPTNIERFRQVAKTIYVPHAYRETLHHPGPADPELECEFSFCGTGYPSRIELFGAMDFQGIDAKLAGNWMRLSEDSLLRDLVCHPIDECFDNDDAVALYQSSQIGMNLYRREAENEKLLLGLTMGPREVEMAACGLFFLRDPRPEGDDVFPMLPTFHGAEDASEKLRWWLAHPDLRAKAATLAREAVADRSFRNHARQLLALLDRQPVSA